MVSSSGPPFSSEKKWFVSTREMMNAMSRDVRVSGGERRMRISCSYSALEAGTPSTERVFSAAAASRRRVNASEPPFDDVDLRNAEAASSPGFDISVAEKQCEGKLTNAHETDRKPSKISRRGMMHASVQ